MVNVLTAPANSWIGSKIGKYSILRELGRGGMGEVYLAEDTHLGREVALKRLLPIFAEDQDFVSRFKREARAISQLAHPGLVSVHSLDWVDGVLLLDMEYVRGTSLLRTLQDSVVTPQFTACLARDLLDALVACHDHGIVHRDIKPSNILLTESLRAKLVDFGIATALADSTATQIREGRSTTVVLGTPRFMPPEAWDGGEVSPQWDLFALGVVLYECLTGSAAYKGTTTAALAKQITNEPLSRIGVRVPGVSAQFANLVDRLVLINPDQRCASARDALALLDGAPELSASPEGSTIRRSPQKAARQIFGGWGMARKRSSKRSRGSVWRWTAALGIAVAAAFGIGVYLASPVGNQGSSLDGDKGLAQAMAPTTQAAHSDHFFRATSLVAADDTTWSWWIAPATKGQPRSVMGYSSLGLLRMTMTESDGGARFDGEWAGFASPLGRGFEQGSVSGTGLWEQGRHSLAATLHFEDTAQRTKDQITFLVEPDLDVSTREGFLRGLERSALLPTLLYREMSPRGVPLAQVFDAALPAVGERVSAPKLPDEAAPIQVDGLLDESTWREPVYGSKGRVGELSQSSGAKVMVRRGDEGLYFAARVPSVGESPISAKMGILLGYFNPPEWAPRGEFELSGNAVSDRTFHSGESEVAFPSGWEIAVGQGKAEWAMELFVPFNDASFWPCRFNLIVQQEGVSGKSVVVAAWGAPDIRELAHGAMITIEESGS